MSSGKQLAILVPNLALPSGQAAIAVTGICHDSRKLVPGDLFLAVRGTRSDGRDHIASAVAAGAAAVLAEAEGFNFSGETGVPVIPVANLNRQVSAIASRFYGEPSQQVTVIGITGTNGKTTCSQLLCQLFSLCGYRSGVIGTLGYGVCAEGERLSLAETGMTTPDAVSTQKILAAMKAQGVARVAMEVSSHSLDQHRVAAVHFSTAVFTNLSRDHLDYHGDLESYRDAKFSLFRMPGLRTAIVNRDDPAGREIAAQLSSASHGDGPRCLTYSVRDDGAADIVASQVQLHAGGINARIDSPWGRGQLRSTLLGEFNLANLLAVVGAACAEGLSLAQVLDRVPSLVSVSGRMQLVDPSARPQVVVDYAHTPDALEKALAALRQHCRGRLWVVFGCGGDRDRGKRPEMAAVAERHADRVLITSDNPRSEAPETIIADIMAGFARPAEVTALADRAECIAQAVAEAAAGDTVLIAGKGHENYQQIGAVRLPFCDLAQARLALRARTWGVGEAAPK